MGHSQRAEQRSGLSTRAIMQMIDCRSMPNERDSCTEGSRTAGASLRQHYACSRLYKVIFLGISFATWTVVRMVGLKCPVKIFPQLGKIFDRVGLRSAKSANVWLTAAQLSDRSVAPGQGGRTVASCASTRGAETTVQPLAPSKLIIHAARFLSAQTPDIKICLSPELEEHREVSTSSAEVP